MCAALAFLIAGFSTAALFEPDTLTPVYPTVAAIPFAVPLAVFCRTRSGWMRALWLPISVAIWSVLWRIAPPGMFLIFGLGAAGALLFGAAFGLLCRRPQWAELLTLLGGGLLGATVMQVSIVGLGIAGHTHWRWLLFGGIGFACWQVPVGCLLVAMALPDEGAG